MPPNLRNKIQNQMKTRISSTIKFQKLGTRKQKRFKHKNYASAFPSDSTKHQGKTTKPPKRKS